MEIVKKFNFQEIRPRKYKAKERNRVYVNKNGNSCITNTKSMMLRIMTQVYICYYQLF